MATGHAYDSEGGRALAAAITSLMTGTAYRRSAELAGVVGPYDGLRPQRRGAPAGDAQAPPRPTTPSAPAGSTPRRCLEAGHQRLAGRGRRVGARNGCRNAQALVLAPTGCLTGGHPGLHRPGVRSPRRARRRVRRHVAGPRHRPCPRTKGRGSRQVLRERRGADPSDRHRGWLSHPGHAGHRIKVVDRGPGDWVWRRMADDRPGDPCRCTRAPSASRRRSAARARPGVLHGDPRHVVPDRGRRISPSWSATSWATGQPARQGLRFCVADADLDVVDRSRGPRQGALRARRRGRSGAGLPGGHASFGSAGPLVAGCRLRQGFPARLITGQGLDAAHPDGDPQTNDAGVYCGVPARPVRSRRHGSCVPSLDRVRDIRGGFARSCWSLGFATTTGHTSAAGAARRSRCGSATSTTRRGSTRIGFLGCVEGEG